MRFVSLLALTTAAIVAATATGAAQAPATAAASDIVVRDAWVREATVGQASTVAYLVIENRSSTPTALTAAHALFATTAELHSMKVTEGSMPAVSGGMDNGMGGEMMTMNKVTEVPVPAKGMTELAPGGYHLMLFKITKPVKAGSTVQLMLHFKGGVTKTVQAKVVAQSAMGPTAH